MLRWDTTESPAIYPCWIVCVDDETSRELTSAAVLRPLKWHHVSPGMSFFGCSPRDRIGEIDCRLLKHLAITSCRNKSPLAETILPHLAALTPGVRASSRLRLHEWRLRETKWRFAFVLHDDLTKKKTQIDNLSSRKYLRQRVRYHFYKFKKIDSYAIATRK